MNQGSLGQLMTLTEPWDILVHTPVRYSRHPQLIFTAIFGRSSSHTHRVLGNEYGFGELA